MTQCGGRETVSLASFSCTHLTKGDWFRVTERDRDASLRIFEKLIMHYLHIMQRERIIWGMGKVRGMCAEFCSLHIYLCTGMQMHACELGWNYLGRVQGVRERLINMNFWRSRIQYWSHLCAQHPSKCMLVHPNLASLRLESIGNSQDSPCGGSSSFLLRAAAAPFWAW